MRHRVAGVKLNRSPAHRRALFRNLVTALLEHEVVRTTDAKAKELRRWGDRMITLGKQNTLHARRRAGTILQSRTVLVKLFNEIAPRYNERAGGYTRVTKLGTRHGDAAPLSIVELVERAGAQTEKTSPKKPQRRRDTGKAKAKTKQPAAPAPKKKRAAAG
jgi:large subunit ribosomal protein L17